MEETAMKRVVLALVTVVCIKAAAVIIRVPGQYPTIQAGIDAAGSGDIVLVDAGTYPEEINLKAGVVVRGAGIDQSIIDGGGDPGDVVRAVGNAIGPDTKLEGFTVRGAANSGGMPGGGGVFCNSGARPEIVRCRLTGNDAGVALWNGSAALVRNCVIDHNTYDGVSTGAGATVVNNTIHANRIGFYDYSGYGPTFMNNIVTGHSLYGVYGPSGGTPPSLTYNDVWGNAEDYRQATPGVGSISHDPLYVDTAAADYHLQPGSPCIDSGNPAPQYNDPDGSRCDIGAYGGPAAPSERPLVVTLVPEANDPAAYHNVDVSAGFNVAMDPATLDGATFRVNGAFTGWHWGTVSYVSSSRVVTLDALDGFWPGEAATATLTRSVLSSGGDSLGGYSWGFTAEVSGGSGLFSTAIAESAPGYVTAVAAGDFDRDGDADVAACSRLGDSLVVLLNDGTGRLQAAHWFAVGAEPAGVVAGDWDSDSILDLAVANYRTNRLHVLTGQGNGDFDPPFACDCPAGQHDIAAADVNLDGALDLVVALTDTDAVAVLAGDGDGTFGAARSFPVGDAPVALAVGDLDADGLPDLAVTEFGSGNVTVLLGEGDGGFTTFGSYACADGPYSVKLGDFNADGILDAAVAAFPGDRVCVFRGDGTGALGSRADYTAGDAPHNVSLADLNGDARLDIAATAAGSNTVFVMLGRGDGTFLAATSTLPLTDALGLTTADMDDDGDVDLIVGCARQVVTVLNTDALRVQTAWPEPYSTGAPRDTGLAAVFSAAISRATLDSTSFKTFGSMTGVHFGATAWDSLAFAARLDPRADFAPGEAVTALLTSRIRSAGGAPLGGYGWTFTTGVFDNASGAFGGSRQYPAGADVRGTWAADFDRDGDIDLAVTSNSPAGVAYLANDGAGAFAAPVFTGTAGDPMSLFGADFDSDGDVDLAVYHNQPGSSHLEMLRNNGSGGFTVAGDYTPAVLGQDVAGADFDSDGDIDLVLSDGWGSQNNVRVMTNNGSGSFTGPVSYSAGSGARGCATLDAEGDGDFDIAVANSSNGTVSLLYNDGSGAFTTQADFAAGSNPDRIACADYTLDGAADIAVGSAGADSVALLVNDGAGRFTLARYACGGASRSIAAGDLDGDRAPDLLLAHGSSGLSVLLNDGSGAFPAFTPYPAGTAPWDCFIADFDSDRALDIGCANYSSNNVSVLFGIGLGLVGNPTPGLSRALHASHVRGVLNLPRDQGAGHDPIAHGQLGSCPKPVALLDATGRKVLDLAPGPNDVSRLAPGVYFVHSRLDRRQSSVSKVVITR
jgi:hypothetical protein